MIGNVLKRRYEIVAKLGYGGFSTVWLARDIEQHTYVALKIGVSDSRTHETTVMKALSESKPSVSTTSVAASGAGAIPVPLDQFTVHGPNGTHPCYTTAVAECNIRDCSSSRMFKLDVARALALKLVSAVAYMHGQGYVHGDIHLGNAMIKLNSGLDTLSIDQLYIRPQTEDISRADEGALPPNVPARAVRPLHLGKPASEISLQETNLLLIDFGESFAPAKTFRPCEDCRSYLAARPPECRFEPSSPLSFSADIWCLGIALWDLIAMKPLFNDQLVPPDSVVAQQQDILGPMPPQWWKQWEKRLEYFDAEGNSTRGSDDTPPPLDEAFKVWGQKYRAKRKAGVLPQDEEAAFISPLSRMLSLDPRGRPSANEVLASEWIKNWAMPSFQQSLAGIPKQNAMPYRAGSLVATLAGLDSLTAQNTSPSLRTLEIAVSFWLTWVSVALVGYLVYRKSTSKKKKSRLPPGPKPMPVLGNINDLPPPGKLEYQHWLEHKDAHGPISSVTVMGMTLIIIHDKKAAHDLLDQVAAKTSGRPAMVMANQLCGYEAIVVCQSYTSTFRRYRKYLHRKLGTKASATQFQDVQEVEVGRQLVRALKHPEQWKSHLKTTAAATVLEMAYGYTIEPDKPDMLVNLIDQMMTEFSLAAVPMAWAVDIIPALRYLPEGIPGIGFKETARRWKKSIHASGYIPYDFVRRQMARFTSRPCYVSKLVQQLTHESADGKLSAEDEHAIIWTAASLYGAAADTTVITLTAFTAAMIMFPEVQHKTQDEIDRVVGSERLPTFADRESLPYIDALVKEASRWWPISPMGFPHTATEDVEYKAMHIPKGSLLLPAVWWFLHDPDVYADPERFDPDRFLTPRSEPDPRTEAFGYGRRICPGRFFADSSLFINIAQTLATFKFTNKVGRDGKEIDVNVEAQPGLLTYPAEFEFQISPRSAKHVTLIEQFERKHAWEAGDAELLDNLENFTMRN